MSDADKNSKPELSALRIDRGDELAGESRAKVWRAVRWVLALAAIAFLGAKAHSRWVKPMSYPQVETMEVRPSRNYSDTTVISASGYLVAHLQANVAPKISGRISKVNFDIGSRVEKGQVLALLENEDLKAQLREAEAGSARAEKEYLRLKSLSEQGVASRSLFDGAEAEAHQSRARVDRLKVVLRDAVVRAPFSGVVVAKNVELGEVVAPLSLDGQSSDETGSIATIADLRTLEVEADVNESNLGKLSDDQPAVIEVDAYEGRSWRGKLRQIVPVADRAKGIVQVKIAFVDPPDKLLPEMSASVSFLEKPRNESELVEPAKLWIPEAALGGAGTNEVAVVTKDDVVELRNVEKGETRNGLVEIVGGLTEGEAFVKSGPGQLATGAKVRRSAPPGS
ncbi:MAG: efflux RND transporter periplasmic adaptor subunit [Thermoanaerobaculia bacterium]|nr:efflux RND transporter periplasmic adaptor subunit [Thermoanaerobaculia bacterium]